MEKKEVNLSLGDMSQVLIVGDEISLGQSLWAFALLR